VLSYLIKHGADLNAVNSNKLSVVAIAAYADSLSAVKLLLSHGADPAQTDIRGMNALYAAVVSGNVATLKALQQHGNMSLITPQQQHIEGRSLLMVAAAEGQRAAVVWILNQCPELANLADFRRSTPLHAAAVCNEPEIIQLLIAAGADMHARDSDGETALDLAMRAAVGPCVAVLVEVGAAGAHALKRQYAGFLYTAISSGQIDSVAQLLQKPGFVKDALNMKIPDRCECCAYKTVLMICKQPAITKLLLAAGADVSVTTELLQCTCLHVAAAHGYPASVICLQIKAGADLHAVNSSGQTAAQVAHAAGFTLIEQLLNRAAQQA
jgi:uncharacterized protein